MTAEPDRRPVAMPDAALARHASGATADDYRAALERIGVDDPETGHTLADDLAFAVLDAIANGHPDPQQLAQATRTVLSADFPRWCA